MIINLAKENCYLASLRDFLLPMLMNGQVTFKDFYRKKKSDNKVVKAKVKVINGCWTLLKGSILGIAEDMGGSMKAKELRTKLPMDSEGHLLDDFSLGECSPSFAGNVVMNQSCDGWTEWKNVSGEPIDIYRKNMAFDD